MDIKQVLNSSQYDFIRTNDSLKDNILFLTFGGSYAYGTNTVNSDIDIRGCTLNSKSDLIGMTNFEQFIDTKTDTTIYSFNKLIRLLINCNPNTIELLGCKKEHYIISNPIGQQLLDNKDLFLSKKAVNSFGGYAIQQLRRLQNFLARDNYTQQQKEKHIMGSIISAMMTFNDRYSYFEDGSIKLNIEKSDKEDLETEIFMDINLKHYPLRDYKNIWAEMNNIVKDYSKLNKRNRKKDNKHLNKHAMHLIRLYLMCLDILEKQQINTYRYNDLDLLMDIRNGKYQKEDGTYYQEFFDLLTDLENRIEYAKNNTGLKEFPNYKRIEEFVMSVNKYVVNL